MGIATICAVFMTLLVVAMAAGAMLLTCLAAGFGDGIGVLELKRLKVQGFLASASSCLQRVHSCSLTCRVGTLGLSRAVMIECLNSSNLWS